MSKNTKETSKTVALKAAKTLTNPNASKAAKKLAGSALTKEMGYNMYIMLSKRYKSQLISIGSLLGWGPLHGPIIIELAEGWEQLLEVKTEKR